MTDFILHIGDGKCGSTSIQVALHEARELLMEQGLMYDAPRARGGHFNYAGLFGRNMRSGFDNAVAEVREHLASLSERIRKEKPEFVIISAENFYVLLAEDVVDFLEDHGLGRPACHIVAYARSPASMYLSSLQQVIKGDHIIPDPNTYRRSLQRPFMSWAKSPQCRSITAVQFSRKTLVDGSSVKDFEERLRLITGNQKISLHDKSVNTSLSAEQMQVLQNFRRTRLAQHSGRLHPDSQALISYFNALNTKFGLQGSKVQLHEELVENILGNNWDIMVRMDRLFPWMEMTKSLEQPVLPETPPKAQIRLEHTDVSELLVDCDLDLVAALETLSVRGREEDLTDADYEACGKAMGLPAARLRHFHTGKRQ